jgi:FkbM family methyltransferase
MSVIYFKRLYPKSKIKAFEADPIIKEYLQNNLSKNNINDVEIINSAVWVDFNGVEFFIEGADGGSVYGNGNANKVRVPSIRLKDFIEKETRIDMLKIDIEGAEYEIIKDCKDSLSRVQNIFIEYHSWNHNNQRLSEILSILENNGFRYYIENITKRNSPFINRAEQNPMDLQLNIWGYRKL